MILSRLNGWLLLGMFVALLGDSPAFGQTRTGLPIAYVSLQRIITEADDAKAGAKELEALRVARTQELSTKKKALDDTKLQLANSGGYFSGSKRAQLAELVKRQEAELQQANEKAQADFQELQKKVQERLRTEIGRIVTALATERGVAYVLNQDAAVVLAPKGADWTDDVLKRLKAASAQTAPEKK